ncbi:MAG: hypothetical protein Q9225_005798 [Loekoesia sp. 1 TL-2023]
MNARSFSRLPLPHCKAPFPNTLLPFLYQTRTIQSPSARLLKVQRSFHTNHLRQRIYGNDSLSSDAIPFEQDPRERVYRNGDASPDAIPFEGDVGSQQRKDPDGGGIADDGPFTQFAKETSARPPRTSTITATEKAVFDRIFKEISSDATKESAKEEDPLDADFGDEESSKGDSYDDLNAIFDEALKNLKHASEHNINLQNEEKRPNLPSKSYMTAINPLANTDTRFLNLLEIREGEDHKAIQKSVTEHRRKVLKKFDEASTDMEIWKVLDTEVFPLIQQYDTLREEAEKREKAKKPKRKRGRISKADQEAAAAAEKKQSLRLTKKSAKEAEIQAIMTSNYGDYCLTAMRHLRRAFPTSPYCMNMLPTIKRLGPISHVLAASVDLYNEILFLQWKEYSDLHGMADLIVEMGNQGIESNEVTLRVLTMVRNARRNAIAEDLPMRLWWDLRPVWTGWLRLKSMAKNVRREIVQARIRRSVEDREARTATDAEGLLPDGEDLQEEAETESEKRMKRAIADEATILHGGLDINSSQGPEM